VFYMKDIFLGYYSYHLEPVFAYLRLYYALLA